MIDGAHRTKAMKDVGEQYIQAEIWEGLSDQEIFEKSVQLNATHGKPFETYEVVNIINKFKETFNYSWEQISDIVRIPVSDIQKFVATRMTRIIETQEPFALKKELYDYAGVGISETSSLPSEQRNFEGSTQIKMVDSLIVILKNDWVTKSEQLDHRFKKLRNLLNERYPED
jgi:hypothetical protein